MEFIIRNNSGAVMNQWKQYFCSLKDENNV